ncbi:transcriptional regulator [Roseomonas sp. KE2513]|uniref:ArsR/SmtB family transcription factor n=1 Tax=Roseomonas sp. KE2513 TaxID=2479202 RepID=UPI0018E05BE2|nr:helix-turn-helix transcriptional regulator [Roseomonas sp. KE2513]MBI0539636.1 transcriptional regulator [Roseomonas sp. KE2513]
MVTTSAFAETAALIGDPARANMLAALMNGRALTAKELAEAAGVTPQTASGHLAQLTGAGLLAMARQGRHRYHRLASPAVAHMLETIMSVAAGGAPGSGRTKSLRVGPRDAALRRARTCYNHLAGRLAVAMADRMTERGHIELSLDGGVITEHGTNFLQGLGVNLKADTAGPGRSAGGRVFCRPCLDWSERRPHIAGVLGTALCTVCLTQGWIRRIEGTRAVTVTPMGRTVLDKAFDLRDALD